MRAILESAGLAVHVYTSPHLVRFHERIRLGRTGGGRFVDEERLVEALRRCDAVNGAQPITVFEITTAAAFWLFAETPADVLLLEVGLGGRARCDERDRKTCCGGRHGDRTRPRRLPRRYRGKGRGREGRRFQARPPGRDRAAGPCGGGCRAARAQRRRAPGRSWSAARIFRRMRSGAGSFIRTRTAFLICRARDCSGAISSSTPARRSRRCAPPGSAARRRRVRGRHEPGRMAGAAAAPDEGPPARPDAARRGALA